MQAVKTLFRVEYSYKILLKRRSTETANKRIVVDRSDDVQKENNKCWFRAGIRGIRLVIDCRVVFLSFFFFINNVDPIEKRPKRANFFFFFGRNSDLVDGLRRRFHGFPCSFVKNEENTRAFTKLLLFSVLFPLGLK